MSAVGRIGARLGRLVRGAVAGFWSYGVLPPLVPRRLVVALIVWPLLLFAFFVIPEVRYLNAPPLFSATNPFSSKADQPVAGQQVRPLAVLSSTMEGDTTQQDNDPAQSDYNNQIRSRVGTNILDAAGYLSAAYYVLDPGGNPPQSYYALTPDGRVMGCAAPYELVPEDLITDHATHVALAIVAVEKFNRNVVHRFAERIYAKLYRAAFGKLPDLSFGPAQIRLSTVRKMAAARSDWEKVAAWASKSDDELLGMLWQECSALKTVTVFVLQELNRPDKDNVADDVTDAAMAYVGQRRRTSALIDYAPIVSAMVSMMEMPAPSAPAPAPAPAPPAPQELPRTDSAPAVGSPAPLRRRGHRSGGGAPAHKIHTISRS